MSKRTTIAQVEHRVAAIEAALKLRCSRLKENMALFQRKQFNAQHVKKSLKYFTLCPPRNQFSQENYG